MHQTLEKPGLTGEILVMDPHAGVPAPADEHVIETLRHRRTSLTHDIRRMTAVFLAGMAEANNELVAQYAHGLSTLRRKLGDMNAFTDPDMVERMIDRVHDRFLNDSRQSILWRFNHVMTENYRQPVDISDDRWLASRRHALGYDTSAVIDQLSFVLTPGQQRENLLALFTNATLNGTDGRNAVLESITRHATSSDLAQTVSIRHRMSALNREKSRWAHIDRTARAQRAATAETGIQNAWNDVVVHETSGLRVEQNRIDRGDVNHTPPQGGTRLGNMFRP